MAKSDFRRSLTSAECLSDKAISFGSFSVKTSLARSSALECSVTSCDQGLGCFSVISCVPRSAREPQGQRRAEAPGAVDEKGIVKPRPHRRDRLTLDRRHHVEGGERCRHRADDDLGRSVSRTAQSAEERRQRRTPTLRPRRLWRSPRARRRRNGYRVAKPAAWAGSCRSDRAGTRHSDERSVPQEPCDKSGNHESQDWLHQALLIHAMMQLLNGAGPGSLRQR